VPDKTIDYFEKLVERGIEFEFREGYAYFERIEDPPRIVKQISEKRSICVTPGRKPLSFAGTRKDGQKIVFEARYADGPIVRQNLISPQRAERLERHSEFKALTFVLIGTMEGCYRVPWKVWRDMPTIFGHRYMSLPELARYKIPILDHSVQILA